MDINSAKVTHDMRTDAVTGEQRDGDPWERLLDHILDTKKLPCDCWKDEVANLLIFAGLFSAIVTTFIVDIVSLLSQISGQPSNPKTPSLFKLLQTCRRNCLLQLILRFGSILSGTASYSVWPPCLLALSPCNDYDNIRHTPAKLPERNRKAVRLILGVLSLYLQTALVLFFIGVIDFLHAVENKTVVVSVRIAIIITLIFLMAATALPSVQVTFLQFLCIFPLRLKEPPSQCPYKSPQLNLFCASSDTFPQFSHLLWCFFGIFFDTFWAIIETQGLKA
ncbi:hypothetical protein CVT25_001141 [Psilocybe cyanescens]|uniref:DUF6535 domain-containing protein n=1 Tax=Psilocybe cyanescens TaxID=93625 RepID=A0A409XB12_PSICY|nr:hypothetical protein CVT25_001141 [Psilocybe cyanescens]